MRHIGAQIHQVGDTVAAAPFGITLQQFSHLEKQHHGHGLGHFAVGTRHEADEQRSGGGNGHEKMLVEGIALRQPFGGFVQGFMPHKQIRNKVNEQQLPHGQVCRVLNGHCHGQQHGGRSYQRHLSPQ